MHISTAVPLWAVTFPWVLVSFGVRLSRIFSSPDLYIKKSPRDTPFHPRCIRMKQAAKCTCFSCFFLYIFSWNVMSFHYVRPTLYKCHKLSCLGSSDSSNTKQVQTKSVCSLPYKFLVLSLESGILKWCSRSLFLNLVVIKFCILVEWRDCQGLVWVAPEGLSQT